MSSQLFSGKGLGEAPSPFKEKMEKETMEKETMEKEINRKPFFSTLTSTDHLDKPVELHTGARKVCLVTFLTAGCGTVRDPRLGRTVGIARLIGPDEQTTLTSKPTI